MSTLETVIFWLTVFWISICAHGSRNHLQKPTAVRSPSARMIGVLHGRLKSLIVSRMVGFRRLGETAVFVERLSKIKSDRRQCVVPKTLAAAQRISNIKSLLRSGVRPTKSTLDGNSSEVGKTSMVSARLALQPDDIAPMRLVPWTSKKPIFGEGPL
jgi:hypothetical protein